VSDLERSIEFYQEYLGFEVRKIMLESGECINNFSALEGVNVKTVKMVGRNNSGMIELLHYLSHPNSEEQQLNYPITNIGCSHFALTVDDLDSLYERLTKNGTPFNYPVQISPDGNVKIAFCRDPDGTLIELVQDL
jgi:catechol 2,3-dioxygenase-like lactoylglutathione lyase family enzyme